MSNTAGDQSGIWSYVPSSLKSSPRRRSVGATLPRSNGHASIKSNGNIPWDPFEKSDRQDGRQPTTLERTHAAIMTQSRNTRWLKAGGILAVVVLIYLFLSTGGAKVGNIGGSGNTYTTANSPTTKCTRPHDSSKPLVQYAIMIDAGSTGSRIHIYKFNNCGPTPELEHEEFKMTETREGGSGLSSYRSDTEGAAKSLDPLLQVAMTYVPDDYKSCTPIAVKATAGLRLLGEEMALAILAAVRTRLETVYPFPVVSKDRGGIEIMPGEMEGVYAWITTNYLLGKIGGPEKSPTAAIFDLGGGSTQIVFEPTFPASPSGGMPETMQPGEHKYSLDFGGRHFELYQHSHLGYGLMSARKALHTHVVEEHNTIHSTSTHTSNPDLTWLSSPVSNPCINPTQSRLIDLTWPNTHPLVGTHSINMTGPSASLPAHCRSLTDHILYKSASCALAPCSFNGIHQPSLATTFATSDIYIFSYFYDRASALGMPSSFTISELVALTNRVCSGPETWQASFGHVPGAIKELTGRPESCLDLSFMVSLLHEGYELGMQREVKIAKKIAGNELGWCLGASLPLLERESGWECRVKQE